MHLISSTQESTIRIQTGCIRCRIDLRNEKLTTGGSLVSETLATNFARFVTFKRAILYYFQVAESVPRVVIGL